MSDRSNPYEAPKTGSMAPTGKLRAAPIEDVPSAPALGTLVVSVNRVSNGETWRIALEEDELWIVPVDQPHAYVLGQREVAEYGDILFLGKSVGLMFRELPKPTTLWLGEGSHATLREWLGRRRTLHIEKALKRRLRLSLPLGLLIGATSIPPLGAKVDLFAAVAGFGLVACSLVAPRRPHHALFAVDGVLWLCLAASNLISVASGGATWVLVFGALQVFFGWKAFQTYRFFKEVPDREAAQAR